jgi:hypothetical protein
MLPKGTELGALSYHEVYFEYNGPQLFSAKNTKGKFFFAMHAPRDETGDNWLWREISRLRLAAIKDNRIDLASVFKAEASGGLFVVTFTGDAVSVRHANATELPEKWFPKPDIYLEEEEEEEEEELSSIPNPQIVRAVEPRRYLEAAAFDLPPELLETPLWREIPEGRALLAAMRVPVHEAAQHSRRIVCDFIIQPGQIRTDVGVASLGSLLMKTQRMMDVFGTSGIPARSMSIARILKSRMELKAVAPFPGSFGLRLESSNGDLAPDKNVNKAFESLFELISAGKNLTAVREILQPLGRRAAIHYRAFAKALADISGDFVAEIGIPGAEGPLRTAINGNEVKILVQLLEAEILEFGRDEEFVGKLMGASLRNRLFLLESDDRAISGRIADEAMAEMENKKLKAIHRAKIHTTVEINEATGEEKERHILLSIEEIE